MTIRLSASRRSYWLLADDSTFGQVRFAAASHRIGPEEAALAWPLLKSGLPVLDDEFLSFHSSSMPSFVSS